MVKKIKPKAEEKEQGSEEVKQKEELLAPDEFLTTTGRAFQWMQDNSGKVLVAIAAVFVLAAGIGVMNWTQGKSNRETSLALARALDTYHRPVSETPAPEGTPADEQPFATSKEKWTAARDQLKDVVDKHGATGPGAVAVLYLADAESHLGEFDAAIGHYQKYLTTTGGTDSLRFLALQGLGHAQEAKGDLKAAAETFGQMARLEGKLGRDYGLYHSGRVLLAAGQKDEAKKALETLTKEKDYESSPLKSRAEELLTTLQ